MQAKLSDFEAHTNGMTSLERKKNSYNIIHTHINIHKLGWKRREKKKKVACDKTATPPTQTPNFLLLKKVIVEVPAYIKKSN